MRKELLWAGVIGISFGLIIAFGAWRVRSSVTLKNGNPSATSTPAPAPGQVRIAIDKPGNLDVVTENPTGISGITKPLTWVVVSTDQKDYLTKSSEDGTFSLEIELSPGLNHLKVSSLNAQDSISSQEVLAVYSTSFKDNPATPTTSESGESSDSAVALKFARAGNPPKAYIGTVTDIVDSTIQIKSTDSQIQQIATSNKEISVLNTKGTANKAVKLTDIAIGDFIVAMGYVDGNDVLDAQRILVSSSPAKSQLSVTMQNVEEVSKKSLILSQGSFTFDKNTLVQSYVDGKTKSAKITDFSESDMVITVSDTTGTPALSRSIFNIGDK